MTAIPNCPLAVEFEATTVPWLDDIRRYAQRLTHSSTDADDLTQTTYLNALLGWHTFRPGTDARRWLLVICRNAFLSGLRRRPLVVVADGAEFEAILAVDGSAWRSRTVAPVDLIDLGPAIENEIGRLAGEYQEVIRKVDVEGHSYSAAAAELGLAPGTLRSRIHRARRLLQQALRVRAQDAGLRVKVPPSGC
jgi:RNA polymerase sigma-70 factor (ECF subfamily)